MAETLDKEVKKLKVKKKKKKKSKNGMLNSTVMPAHVEQLEPIVEGNEEDGESERVE